MDPESEEERQDMLKQLIAPHLESYNYFLTEGLSSAVENLYPLTLDACDEHESLKLWIRDVVISKPRDPDGGRDMKTYPLECRQSKISYTGQMTATICYEIDDGDSEGELNINMGQFPIMVGSVNCHLHGMSQEQKVARGEEPVEQGGYFITNGAERIIRLLIVPRRNHITALIRPSFTNRGSDFTHFATQIRCVRDDQSGETVTLHYLKTGECKVRMIIRRQEFFISAVMILFALRETTSKEIFKAIVEGGTRENHWEASRALYMLRSHSLKTRRDVLVYLGGVFRSVFTDLPSSMTDVEVAETLLDRHLLVHVDINSSTRNKQKFDVLVLMIQKLYALAKGDIKPENPDALSSHEILLPGHLMLMVVKEKLQEFLYGMAGSLDRLKRLKRLKGLDQATLRKQLSIQMKVGDRLQYLITTGNLQSNTGLDLMQTTGFTIVADKLNFFRYLSHFRSVHRGQFFTTMKTTAVRKLLPESWGFLCPVHTPDGSPCGLLNHLAATCEIITHPPAFDRSPLLRLLRSIGMGPVEAASTVDKKYVVVCLDGVVVGRVATKDFKSMVKIIRRMKVTQEPRSIVPERLEIIPIKDKKSRIFPGLYLSTSAARLSRLVYNLTLKAESKGNMPATEWISPMEQCYLRITCTPDDFEAGESTHQEIHPARMLSLIASLTPFSDFNQSPRNMYQCQMGKQSMGHPMHSIPNRSDNTVYRIQTPQSPIVRNQNLSKYGMDEYPIGTNAIVAVISYTGYDMEDAMIINKSSFERGFGHGSVYKFKTVDLADYHGRGEADLHNFGNHLPPRISNTPLRVQRMPRKCVETLGKDGLPEVGQTIRPGEPLACIIDRIRMRSKIVKLKGVTEKCIVQEIRILQSKKNKVTKVGVKLLLNRNPVIGDKFSSRHGQKGVMSRLFPQTDMPFTESGMCPDVIINPHAFPSRMTIGMLIESMAGKSGALHGVAQDATPFQFSETNRATDYFGKQLVQAGYNYCGNETMYSGFTGEPLTAEIFIGLVYYQRLRHMVSDKSQVRATGPVNKLTRQPIKGRKVHGGIRFGEMERDSLIAHGTAFLLHDRLIECSDYHEAHVCEDCGSLLGVSTTLLDRDMKSSFSSGTGSPDVVKCRQCASKRCPKIVLPYVFTYLAHELGAMNIQLKLTLT